MSTFKVLQLFPTPVGCFEMDRQFTKSELNCINKQARIKNTFNERSKNGYVLDSKSMLNLKKFLTTCVNAYFQNIFKPPKDVSIHITQSWLNYSNKNESHHKHGHPNSFVSGVLYINADVSKDAIVFCIDENYDRIKFFPQEFNSYNSKEWIVPVQTGALVLFPSNLQHYVPPVISEKERVSLSFNTYLKGKLGSEVSSTELILE